MNSYEDIFGNWVSNAIIGSASVAAFILPSDVSKGHRDSSVIP